MEQPSSNLTSGSRLGPYEIISLLGSGGMGEVYKARDTRLGRNVAVKVLPEAFAADPDRLARFEREARAVAALSHPNILSIYDLGREGKATYAVMELLEGETLGEMISRGPLPPSRAIELALQVAKGLSAAHGKGIVHRDLKPGNVFVTRDGHVKILDFGLARLLPRGDGQPGGGPDTPTLDMPTRSGIILGTVGYMSPEQARGLPSDHRSDLFAFGALLYELLSGKKAFLGETATDILAAILREDPAPLPAAIPPALDRIVRQCLAKRPEERFSSAHDAALALQAITSMSTMAPSPLAPSSPPVRMTLSRRWAAASLLGLFALVATASALSFLIGRGSAGGEPPAFQRLTFRRGRVTGARFAPEGHTVVYSAQWEGGPSELFSVRLDGPESLPIGVGKADLLAVSPSSELALCSDARFGRTFFAPVGVLALAPFSGGTPRAAEEGVAFADWSPAGEEMALVRETDAGAQLEYPRGKVLYQTPGFISNPRVSPDGRRVAFIDHAITGDSQGVVAAVDLAGKMTVLSGSFYAAEGLAWSPSGEEVWFTAARKSGRFDLYAVSTGGRERVVLRQSVPMVLHDVARDGRVLLSNEESKVRLFFGGEEGGERDLSWLDWSVGKGLTREGRNVLIAENGAGAAGEYWLYMRETSGSPPMKLCSIGGGDARLTPDERSVVVAQNSPPAILIYPVGPGQPKTISLAGFSVESAGLFPDGRSLWFAGGERSRPVRTWVTDLSGSKPRPVTPEGAPAENMSPDGKSFACRIGGSWRLCPTDGGEPRPIEGLLPGEWLAGWGEDGRSLYAYKRREVPVAVYRVDLQTGRREEVRVIRPADSTGSRIGIKLMVTPDGKSYAYHFWQTLSELHVVTGLK